MKKNIKLYLDYIPFIILCVSAVKLLWTISTSDIIMTWEHYVGLLSLLIIFVLFYKRHFFGVLSLGLILLIGLIGFLSFSPSLTSITFGFGNNRDWSVDIIRFQPVFLFWIVIHFIFSGRYYVGILSKKFRQEMRNKNK